MRIRSVVVLVLLGASCANGSPIVTTPSPTSTGNYKAQPTEWFLRSIASDDRTISLVYTISGVASGCERKGTTATAEFADRVVVTANKSVLQDRARACTQELGYIDAEVRLNAPLGSRALVGCRPPKTDAAEDRVCRDRNRAGGLPPAQPSPAR